MNNYSCMGRLTSDVSLAYSEKNPDVAYLKNGAIAINIYKGKDVEPETLFLNLVAFGKSAEFISKYFKKGDMIGINGSLVPNVYENKDGVKIRSINLQVASVHFCGSKNEDEKGESSTSVTTTTKSVSKKKKVDDAPEIDVDKYDIDDEKIPF